MNISWNKDTKDKFTQMIDKVPLFLKEMARDRVSKKAEEIAQKEGAGEVTEKEMVAAFFAVTPFGFHGPMKSDLESLGIDYTRYGHEK